MLPFALESLDLDAGSEPLNRRLYLALRDAILAGRLAAGTRLPSSRGLAQYLDVSRNTVVSAFEQLQAEGYIIAKVGHGSRVAPISDHLPMLDAGARPAGEPLFPLAPVEAAPRPFQPGTPDVGVFPHQVWARLLARHARTGGRHPSPYAASWGDPALREAVAAHVRTMRGVICGAGNVLITCSAQAAMDFMSRLLLAPGAAAWMEDPGYPGARTAIAAACGHVVPVPVDEHGLAPAHAPPGPPPRLIYVTPSHQFPLGGTMPLNRRLELLDMAAAMDAYILEDDYDAEFRFSGRPVASLQGLDRQGRVIYLGTFSKTLIPGLRTGFAILPDRLMERARHAEFTEAWLPSAVVQAALAEFMTAGHYSSHIKRMRSIYAKRLEALKDAARRFPPGARFVAGATGLQAPLLLPAATDVAAIVTQAAAEGLQLTDLAPFSLTGTGPKGLLLGYASVDETRLRRAAEHLGRILDRHMPRD